MALTAEATGSKSFKSRRWADVSEMDSPLLFWASRPHGSPWPVLANSLGDRGKRNRGKDGTGKKEEDEEKEEEEETARDLSTPKLK